MGSKSIPFISPVTEGKRKEGYRKAPGVSLRPQVVERLGVTELPQALNTNIKTPNTKEPPNLKRQNPIALRLVRTRIGF
jgi:hypothetical protein